MAYLKQKEVEMIGKVTFEWKEKEAVREKKFQDTLAKIGGTE